MIIFLEGTFQTKNPAFVWMDVNGVGYEVNISLNTYTHIQHLEKGKLLIHYLIREDAHILYGFYDDVERNMFLSLLSVKGVGAATARMMLSSMKPDEIKKAILTENEKIIGSIKGIGAKTTKQIILDLKDKLFKQKNTEIIATPAHNNLEEDALNALVSLGIARNAAYLAIQKVLKNTNDLPVQELIKHALQNL